MRLFRPYVHHVEISGSFAHWDHIPGERWLEKVFLGPNGILLGCESFVRLDSVALDNFESKEISAEIVASVFRKLLARAKSINLHSIRLQGAQELTQWLSGVQALDSLVLNWVTLDSARGHHIPPQLAPIERPLVIESLEFPAGIHGGDLEQFLAWLRLSRGTMKIARLSLGGTSVSLSHSTISALCDAIGSSLTHFELAYQTLVTLQWPPNMAESQPWDAKGSLRSIRVTGIALYKLTRERKYRPINTDTWIFEDIIKLLQAVGSKLLNELALDIEDTSSHVWSGLLELFLMARSRQARLKIVLSADEMDSDTTYTEIRSVLSEGGCSDLNNHLWLGMHI
jgi:hypothetical protein